jgi:hypothetical protein
MGCGHVPRICEQAENLEDYPQRPRRNTKVGNYCYDSAQFDARNGGRDDLVRSGSSFLDVQVFSGYTRVSKVKSTEFETTPDGLTTVTL